jgi:uncharacterized protein (TIGR03437 family)
VHELNFAVWLRLPGGRRAAAFLLTVLWALGSASGAGLVNVSGATFAAGPLAPESIVTAKGTNLSTLTVSAVGGALGTSLGGVRVSVTDSQGAARDAQLYYVSPTQVNYVLPAGTAAGTATVQIGQTSGTIQVAAVSPGIFTKAQNGTGVAAAQVYVVSKTGSGYANVFECDVIGQCQPAPITLNAGEEAYLILYGTGIRGRSSLSAVQAKLGGAPLEVTYAGSQNQYPGLDQVNIRLPGSLTASQLATLTLTVDGSAANSVPFLFGSFAGAVTARFDPATPSVGPFPSDYLTVADGAQKTGKRVNLPLTDCGRSTTSCPEIALLNQLDGFNLQVRINVRFNGAIDPASMRHGLYLLWLDNLVNEEKGLQPSGHLTAINQVVFDPATNTVYGKPDEPLDQHRQYAILVTDGVRDAAGAPVAADPAFEACIAAASTAYCGRVAAAVKAATPLLAPHRIVSASVFTTLSVTAWMEQARTLVRNTPPAYQPDAGKHVFNFSDIGVLTWKQQVGVNPVQFNTLSIPIPALFVPSGIGRVAFGSFQSPRVLGADRTIAAAATGSGLTVTATGTERLHFNAYLPGDTKPAAGYPVVIFGHGYTDSNFASPTAVAGNFAQAGFATVAINAFGHGYGPLSVVSLLEASGTTDISAGGRGVDANGDNKIDSGEGCLTFSPPVGLRDCLRQTVIDLEQLVHAIETGIDLDGDGSPDLDPSRIYYSGISLGAIYGTMLTALEPGVRASGLNAGGGTIVDIARWGKAFHSDGAQFLVANAASLLNRGNDFDEDYVLRDQPTKVVTVSGAVPIQNYFERLEWLQVSGDPVGYAPHIRTSPLPGSTPKPAMWQFARGDQTVPNPMASNLVRGAGMQDSTVLYRHDLALTVAPSLGANPHAFLANITGGAGLAIANAAQRQIAGFLKSGGTSIPDANTAALTAQFLGAVLFLTAPALPEDLGY